MVNQVIFVNFQLCLKMGKHRIELKEKTSAELKAKCHKLQMQGYKLISEGYYEFGIGPKSAILEK